MVVVVVVGDKVEREKHPRGGGRRQVPGGWIWRLGAVATQRGTWCSWLSRSLSMREVLGSIPNVSILFVPLPGAWPHASISASAVRQLAR